MASNRPSGNLLEGLAFGTTIVFLVLLFVFLFMYPEITQFLMEMTI